MVEPSSPPPDDPDEWTEQQWMDWLNADRDDGPDERPLYWPKPGGGVGGAVGGVLGAAMIGMHNALYGEVKRPEIVEEADADGKDDGMKIRLDPDDPTASVIDIPAGGPAAGAP